MHYDTWEHEMWQEIEDLKARLAALEAAAKEQPDELQPQPEPAMPHRLNLNHCGMRVLGWDDGDKETKKGVLWGIDFCSGNAGCKYMIYCDDPGCYEWTQHARLVSGIAPDEYTAVGTLVKAPYNSRSEELTIYSPTDHQVYADHGYVIADEQPHLED